MGIKRHNTFIKTVMNNIKTRNKKVCDIFHELGHKAAKIVINP